MLVIFQCFRVEQTIRSRLDTHPSKSPCLWKLSVRDPLPSFFRALSAWNPWVNEPQVGLKAGSCFNDDGIRLRVPLLDDELGK